MRVVAVRWNVYPFNRLDSGREAHGKAEAVGDVTGRVGDHGKTIQTLIPRVNAFEREDRKLKKFFWRDCVSKEMQKARNTRGTSENDAVKLWHLDPLLFVCLGVGLRNLCLISVLVYTHEYV